MSSTINHARKSSSGTFRRIFILQIVALVLAAALLLATLYFPQAPVQQPYLASQAYSIAAGVQLTWDLGGGRSLLLSCAPDPQGGVNLTGWLDGPNGRQFIYPNDPNNSIHQDGVSCEPNLINTWLVTIRETLRRLIGNDKEADTVFKQATSWRPGP